METVFIKLLNMSISASWLILAVVIIRLFLKKAPRWSVCILWGFVALKLIVPFSFKSIFSLIPSDEVIPETIATEAHPHITSGIIYVDTAVNPVMEAHLAPQVGDSANPMQIVIFIASLVWCIGMVICMIYAMTSFIILKRKVRASKKISDKIYACDDVKSPFILGILRPVIYIPSGMNKDTLDYVIAHENAHLKRGDHFWKPLGFLILSVYWFNPICWVAYILLCRDIEFACDEKVIRDKDNTYVNSYSQALLDCNAHRRIIAACPLAFGETSVKDRIKGVLNYKKPAFWVVIVAVIICIAVAVCFMTNPKDESKDLSMLNYRNAIALIEQDGIKDVQFNQSDKTEAVHGTVNNADLINFFKNVEWKEEKSVPEIIEPTESLVFVISNDYRITLYKEAAVACVKNMDQSRYYKTGSGDYNDAFSLTRMFTLSDYQEELDKINKELGTEYIFTPEDGRDLREAEAFYQQMSLDEFREYIYNASEAAKAFEDQLEIKPTKIDTLENREWNWPTIHKYGIGTRIATDSPDYIEILASYKDPAFAACTGDIVETGIDAEWGNYIVQDIGDGVTLKYGHLKNIYVNKGDHAEAGRVLGNISEGNKPGKAELLFAIFNNEIAVDPISVTDNWKYVEYEDLKLLNRTLSYRVWNYQEGENPGIDLDVDPFGYDEQGGVIKLQVKVDNRIYDDAEIQSPEFQEMVDEITDRLNDSLEEVFMVVLEGRIDKNRYRVKVEILPGYWEKDIVIERLHEQGKL